MYLKKLMSLLFFVVFGLCLFFYSSLSKAQVYESFRLVVLGDSLSSGYKLPDGSGFVPQLQQALLKDGLDNVEVISAAVAGDTTFDAVDRMDSVLNLKPHAVLLELGANDILEGEDLNQTQQNLETMVSAFLQQDIPVMLIGVQLPSFSDSSNRNALDRIYKNLSKKYDLHLYPHFLDGAIIERFGVYNAKHMQADNVHPNEEGIRIIVSKIYPSVKKFLTSI